MAMRWHRKACATPSESLGKPPLRSRWGPGGGGEKFWRWTASPAPLLRPAAAPGGMRPFPLMIFRGVAYTMAAPGASGGG